MSTSKKARARLALLPAIALGAGVVAGPVAGSVTGSPVAAAADAAVASAAPPATKGATVDWFDDEYTALGAGSVFETATMERFEYLLKKPGKFAFIIGGPDSATLQSSIGYINEVAKANGIEKIYNFNPELDGGTLNVFDPSQAPLSQTGKDYVGQYGTGLVDNYLSKDAETPFSNAHTSDPYLFVYDGSGGDTARITGALTAPVSAADLDTPGEVSAYKQQVKDVLTSGGTVGVDTQFDFLAGEHNRRLATRSKSSDPATYDQTKYGAPIFTDADKAAGFRLQSVTYPELVHILQSPGDFALLFGGTWCHNTAAVIKEANAAAQEFGIKTVYTFDFVLNTNDQTASNGGTNLLHIRDNAVPNGTSEVRRASYLYGDLVNTYLTNAVTQYRTTDQELGTQSVSPVKYYPQGNAANGEQLAHKIQVGHVLTYNKDHKDAQGHAAPVTGQAIRKNADGSFLEYMTEVWFVQGQNLPRTDTSLAGNSATASEANLNLLENQRNFAHEGIQAVRNTLGALAGGQASQVAVSDVPTSIGVGNAFSATATISAPTYDGFYSDNTVSGTSGSAAPSTGVAKPTGTVTVREGATTLGSGTLTNGSASVAFPSTLSAGQHTLTFAYSGSADGVIAPSTTTTTVNVVAATASLTVDAPTKLAFGKGGTVTATIDSAATGSITLKGLGADKTATITGGKATFAIPADVAVGSHTLDLSYAGDSTYGAAQKSVTLSVEKAASTSAAATKATTYGKAATVTVTVAAGDVPLTGSVTLTGAGAALTQPVSGGKATFTLPKTLAAKTYALTATYDGDTNVAGSSAKTSLTVGKAGIAGLSYKLNTKPTAKKKGKATIYVGAPSGLSTPTGKVTVTLKKGKTVKKVAGTLAYGKKVIALPTLTKGTWKLTVAYGGSANYLGWTSKAYAFHITK